MADSSTSMETVAKPDERSVTGRATAIARAVAAQGATLPQIPFVGIHSVSPRPSDVDNATRSIYRLGMTEFELRPPADWASAPYAQSEERAFFQNSFTFADLLLVSEMDD